MRASCSRCGSVHPPRSCPAYGINCHKCGTFGHFARLCKKKNNFSGRQQVAALMENEDTGSKQSNKDEEFAFIGALTTCAIEKETKWNQQILVNNNSINFKIDTGSEVNLLPLQIIEKWMEKPDVYPATRGVIAYNKQELEIIGECKLICKVMKKRGLYTFYIVRENLKPIFGADSSEELGLVERKYPQQIVSTLVSSNINKLNEIIDEFSDVFEGTGKLPGYYHITVAPNVQPKIAAPRSIPQALQSAVKAELARMEAEEIIVRVTKPSEWVHPLAITIKKNGKIRLCLDPRQLNKVIKREHYRIPTQEELFARLGGCTIFSLFDASDGFWQLQLDQQSSELCTFSTQWGRYRYCRLPFGLSCAPELFQKAMDEIFSDQEEYRPYFDDVLVAASNEEEHNRLVHKLLTIARNKGLKFNRSKLKLGLNKISYLGHTLTGQGISPDPDKVAAIVSLKAPENVEQLRRFLGMVTYLTKFIPCFSQKTSLLRSLLKKGTAWMWDVNYQKEYDHIKALITTAPILSFFDPKLPVIISTDASSYGVGSVLMQNQHPVAFASASLTLVQQAWAQIEKELLAVTYACERFHYFILGTTAIVHTDHKPLLGLLEKPLEKITPRLQRLVMRLQRYDVKLQYVPGKFLNIADTLSRAPGVETYDYIEEREDVTVCTLVLATTPKLNLIRDQTRMDTTLQQVIKYLAEGWPKPKMIRDPEIYAFSKCKEELYVADGIVCKGQQMVLPKVAQPDALERLHVAHRGIIATKSKARMSLYWPSMNTDIERLVNNCIICQQHQNNNQREPMIDRPIPVRPWERLALDFFHFKQKDYLAIMDYFSKYVEVQLMSTTTAKGVIQALKTVFARFGIPSELVSDNGPPWDSREVKEFFLSWDINHNPVTPYNPRSNGLAERTIQTLKKSLSKADQDGKDLFVVLMDNRSTPINGLQSPAELLMGRRIRTLVPTLLENLQPHYKIEETKARLEMLQKRQHRYGDKGTKDLKPLNVGQEVWFTLEDSWQPGIIWKVGPQMRSYNIRSLRGREYRRNRYHLRPRTIRNGKQTEELAKQQSQVRIAEDYHVEEIERPPSMTENQHQRGDGPQGQPRVSRSGRAIIKPLRYRD